MTRYVFDNAWQRGRERLDTVEALLDPGTIRHLDALGIESGWQCLEVGAGGGSVAAWMCHRVGRGGRVVATDIDTRFLEVREESNLDVRRHDIVNDELGDNTFDMIHARLVLEHLPGRQQALRRMTRALKPGGWLLIEALDYVSGIPISERGASEHARTQHVRLHLMGKAGLDAEYGRKLPAELRAQGLTDIGAEGRVWVMEGGSPGARWFRLSMEQLRDTLVGPGKLDDQEVDRMLELFEDPNWSALTPIIMAAWGRRPSLR